MHISRNQLRPSASITPYLYLLSGLFLCVQLLPLLSSEYGYFRDELYYIACAKRLAWGYVDHPPLAPILLRIVLAVLGDSLFVVRLVPACAGAATVLMTGLIARQLGGGAFAQSLAAICMVFGPGFLIFSGFFSMNPLEGLLWSGCVYLIIRMLQRDNPRTWILVGVLIGMGLMNKHTIVVYALSLVLGLLFTRGRRLLLSRWFWAGMLLSSLIAFPNLLWQFQHGFPSLEFYQNANLLKNVDNSALEVLIGQVFIVNPLAFPVWLAGLCFFLFSRQARSYRVFGLIYLFLLGTMMWAGSSRPDRMLAAYPVLFAGGGVLIARLTGNYTRWALQAIVAILVLAGGVALSPVSIPFLSPDTLLEISQKLSPPQVEKGASAKLPQWFADRFAWKAMAARVAEAYGSLPDEEKEQTLLLAENYGEAGALEFYGGEYLLPRVLSPHNTFHLWSLNAGPARNYVAIGLPKEQLRSIFQDVTEIGRHTCTYCMDYENNLPIYLCRNARRPYEDWWPEMKWFGGAKKK